MGFLVNPADAHFWIALALVVFIAVLWRAKVPGLVTRTLDEAGAKVQAQLDEAARLREEAQTLLAQIKVQHEETETAAAQLMIDARADAERLRAQAQAGLEEDLRRRRALAERRIATAEAQASFEVRAAAADLAADIAQQVLAARIAGATTDPMIDEGLKTLGERFS